VGKFNLPYFLATRLFANDAPQKTSAASYTLLAATNRADINEVDRRERAAQIYFL